MEKTAMAHSTSNASRLRLAAAAALVFALAAVPPAAADAWAVDVPVYLAGGTYAHQTSRTTRTTHALSAFVEFRVRPPSRTWSASLFVDKRVAPGDADTSALTSGAFGRWYLNDWDLLAAAFVVEPHGAPSFDGYAARLRYRLAERHRVGVEAFGEPGDIDRSWLMLAYYGDLSESLSLRLAGGTNVASGRDRIARVELVWQVSP